MAAKLGADGHSAQRRAFVLVDKDTAQGVFSSWDAAETFADENHFSLDRLLEFETNRDHPDHLHLMAAKWEDGWKFVGEWSKFAPYWESAPSHIRLDHYHARGRNFVIFRQIEFPWKPGLLQTINPMAPDEALRFDEPVKPAPESPRPPQFQPKLSPLKPLGRPQPPKPAETPDKPVRGPLIPEPEPPVEETPANTETQKPQLAASRTPNAPLEIADGEVAGLSPNAPKPKISFQKRKPLRLKSQKQGPKPIPDFKPAPPPPTSTVDPHHSSVELAQAQVAAQVAAVREQRDAGEKPRRIWPLRVLIPIFSIFLCWGGGLYWVFKPEPTAQNMLTQVTTLARARVLVIEPGQIFFQLKVDPIDQQRWVKSLQLDPISEADPFFIPTYHTLDT
jgi:hypothetical protein